MKKLISFILALTLCLGAFSFIAAAKSEELVLKTAEISEESADEYFYTDEDGLPVCDEYLPEEMDKSWYIIREGATRIAVTFGEYLFSEAYEDYIHLYNGNGDLIGKYTHRDLSNKTFYVEGDTLRIRLLITDSMDFYGFRVEAIRTIAPTTYNFTFEEHEGLTGKLTVTLPEGAESGELEIKSTASLQLLESTVGAAVTESTSSTTDDKYCLDYTLQGPAPEGEVLLEATYRLIHGHGVNAADLSAPRWTLSLNGGETATEEDGSVYISVVPFVQTKFSGTCGENLRWALDTVTGVMDITGTGEMYNYIGACDGFVYGDEDVITSVNIHEGVTSIGNYAFDNCNKITSLSLPSTLVSIGYMAFNGCSAIESINLPQGLSYIGDYAFDSCAGLESISIPASVSYIGSCAFVRCTSVEGFSVAEDNPNYCSADGVLFNKAKSKLLAYPAAKDDGSYTVPNGVKTIDYSAFESCHGLENISLPASLKLIAERGFWECKNLGSISFPEGLNYIGDNAFEGCCSLTSVSIPEGVFYLGAYAFKNCEGLKTVNINSDEISQQCFAYCHALETVNLSEGLTRIEDGAFYYCTALESIVLPESVEYIGGGAFSQCEVLARISIPDRAVIIGGGVVDDTAFYYNNENWVDHTLYIGNHLIEVKWGMAGVNYAVKEGTVNIAAGAFSENYITTAISLPTSLKTIGSYAFYNCNALESVALPAGFEYVGDSAFNSCDALESISLPDSVSYIGKEAFLDTAYYNKANNWQGNALYIGKHFIRLKADDDGYDSQYTVKPGTLTLADNAFEECQNLVSVTLPQSVKVISNKAFSACYSLRSVSLPDGIISVGEKAFYCCLELENIVLPQSLEYIGAGAFYNCNKLKELDIPDGVSHIGASAFARCESLTSIRLPKEIKVISYELFSVDRSFSNNMSLKTVYIPDGVILIDDRSFTAIYSIETVYFGGSEAQWNSICVGSCNEVLFFANVGFGASLGDVSGDGTVNSLDAAQTLKYDAELVELDDTALAVADVNGDGTVNSLDAAQILKYDAKLIAGF